MGHTLIPSSQAIPKVLSRLGADRGEPCNEDRGESCNADRGEPCNADRGEPCNADRGEPCNVDRGEPCSGLHFLHVQQEQCEADLAVLHMPIYGSVEVCVCVCQKQW